MGQQIHYDAVLDKMSQKIGKLMTELAVLEVANEQLLNENASLRDTKAEELTSAES